jgi:kynurenine formamidase
MFVDLTLTVDASHYQKRSGRMVLYGHVGTHFDVLDKEFPLEFVERKAVVFDVSSVSGRDIDVGDVELSLADEGCFVAFYTGFIDQVEYGSDDYFEKHPRLSYRLIDRLLEKKISIIGLDFAGPRRGDEHHPADVHCARHGVFVVENLCNLHKILRGKPFQKFIACTFPVKFKGLSGLPCRVVGKVNRVD